jgi:hypothetical protein
MIDKIKLLAADPNLTDFQRQLLNDPEITSIAAEVAMSPGYKALSFEEQMTRIRSHPRFAAICAKYEETEEAE